MEITMIYDHNIIIWRNVSYLIPIFIVAHSSNAISLFEAIYLKRIKMEFAKIPIRLIAFYNSVRRAPVSHHLSKSVFKALFIDTDLNSSFISCEVLLKHIFRYRQPCLLRQNITSYFVGNCHNLAIIKHFT